VTIELDLVQQLSDLEADELASAIESWLDALPEVISATVEDWEEG
jgi:hypothetical protein